MYPQWKEDYKSYIFYNFTQNMIYALDEENEYNNFIKKNGDIILFSGSTRILLQNQPNLTMN